MFAGPGAQLPLRTLGMETTYRTPHEETPSASGVLGPREVLGRISVPVVGDVDAEIGLGRSLHLELDRSELVVQPGSGLVVRAAELPTVVLRRLHVDLVQGVVRSDADALGPFFDRVLTVALCSALRQSLSWQPGGNLAELAARRMPHGARGGHLPVWAQRRFPRARVGVHPDTRLAVLRVLGLGLKVVMVRWLFGAAKVEVKAAGLGPVRRLLLVGSRSCSLACRCHQPACAAPRTAGPTARSRSTKARYWANSGTACSANCCVSARCRARPRSWASTRAADRPSTPRTSAISRSCCSICQSRCSARCRCAWIPPTPSRRTSAPTSCMPTANAACCSSRRR